jgi:putative hemolysin
LSGDPLLWLLLLQFLFILVNAIFACAEIAVISLNDNKLAQLSASGNRRALRLSKLVEQPARFLATIQVGITLINLFSAAVATKNFSGRLIEWFLSLGIPISVGVVNTLSVTLITLVLTYFTVLFGELVPKRIAMQKAERISLAMSGPLSVFSKIFTPAVWLFTVSTNGFLRLLALDPNYREKENTEEEIRMMLDVGKTKGTIQQDEQDMIQNIFEFDDIALDEIMTHRTDVVMLWLEETDQEWEKTIYDTRHSSYPVCAENTDDIVGILSTKDYFRLPKRNRDIVMKQAVSLPYFVPRTARANTLFRTMKKTRNHVAIVIDEYGGMCGIVTMNDLLEQLVGDLDDDPSVSTELPLIEKVDANRWRIRGTAPLYEVSLRLGVSLPDEDYVTFGGLVFGMLGTIPSDGSTPEIEGHGLKIRILTIKDRRLEIAEVNVLEKENGKE